MPALGISVTRRFILCAAVLLVVVAMPLAIALDADRPVTLGATLVVYLVATAITFWGLGRFYPHDRLGTANVVTLTRLALIAPLMVPMIVPSMMSVSSPYAWGVLALATFSLSLDGVDGMFARREKLVSGFGARFDVEVDALFALMLSIIALQLDKAGPMVLVLGLTRYVFVAASLVWPFLAAPLPERFSRKVICVIQIGTLIALLAPLVTPPLSWTLATAASALMLFSFGRDIVWLHRNRP
ncbi:CDP-alcohol phosphatidyltransferase family protein [Pelagibacterium montanilacus]|uniref:CDP-alcohol phosphatidyltransferase family protein n=1 Tax=Pelagibacterium montanilacus TaxID=2185280 RepID=UPI0019D0F33C|nr:CDP-alcohol phosphatidyltransferase family protein [Pelagibacterium montanilacus]